MVELIGWWIKIPPSMVIKPTIDWSACWLIGLANQSLDWMTTDWNGQPTIELD